MKRTVRRARRSGPLRRVIGLGISLIAASNTLGFGPAKRELIRTRAAGARQTAVRRASRALEVYPPPHKERRPEMPLVAPRKTRQTPGAASHGRADLVRRVSPANLERWVRALSAYSTRHSRSPVAREVADRLAGEFRRLKYARVRLHRFQREGHEMVNIICTKPGVGNTGQRVILGAHYDSRTQDLEDAQGRAPGADDNASGVAVLLEVARVLAAVPLPDTVEFVAFSGEEQGLWGSTAYAHELERDGVRLRYLLNLDQVGFPPSDGAIIIEQDLGNRTAQNDRASQTLAGVIAQLGLRLLTVPVKLGPIYSSDYMPFESRGYTVAGLYSGGENPAYHRGDDTAESVDFRYLTEIAKLTLATLLEEPSRGGRPHPAGNRRRAE